MTAHVANCLRRCTLHLPHPVPFHVRQATTRSPRRPPLSHVWAALLILYIGSTITKQGVTQRHIAKTEQGKTVTGTGYVRCHAGMATLLCRHGNVVTPAWQRCYGGVATLLRRRGNVVTAAWQRATRHVDTGTAYYVMDLWVIKTAKVNGKQQGFSSMLYVRCICASAI